MSYTKTVSEFSSSRKIRYGENNRNKSTDLRTVAALNSRQPLNCEETLSSHTAAYSKDSNNNDIYVIEFNIGSFKFDELNIRTEPNKLYVQGKSKSEEDDDEDISKEFKREFKLPNDCDEKTIKASLDDKTRLLKLVGQVDLEKKAQFDAQRSSYASMNSDKLNQESYQTFNNNYQQSETIGNVKEVQSTKLLEYEIYLGNELKDGQVIFEVPNKTTLNIRIIKNGSDSNGDFNLELKREIRLPSGAKLNNIDHGVDSRTKQLIIKVPLN